MSRKPETRLQRKIRGALEEAFPRSKWYKIHGNEFQDAGIADLLGCVEGLFFALEVKMPGEEPSKLQLNEIEEVKTAGGVSCVVESAGEAINVVRRTLNSVRVSKRPVIFR